MGIRECAATTTRIAPCSTGLYAAQNIFGGRRDLWSVNTEQSYREEAESGADSLFGDWLTPTKRLD